MQWRAGGGGSSELLRALHLLCFLPLISKAVFESNWTGVRELSPLKSLQAEFAGLRKGVTFNGSTNAEFHWVVTACDIRPQWALSMTTTILHGLLHGVNPTTLSVVWCKHYNNKSVPMELYNLRHSKSWNVLFIPKDVQPKTQRERSWVSYHTALSVPDILKRPELPVLITEDDLLFTLDFGKKLNDMITQMKDQGGGKPYVASLYSADPKVLDSTEKVIAKYMEDVRQGKHSPRPCQMEGTCSTGVQAVRGNLAYMSASLAMLYSPESRKVLMEHFSQVIAQAALGKHGHPTDVLIGMLFRFQLKCSAGGDCELFRAVPSMVEHTGTLSAARGTRSRRFHTSADFPFEVAFPTPNLTALNGNLSMLNSGDGFGDGSGTYGNTLGAPGMLAGGGLRRRVPVMRARDGRAGPRGVGGRGPSGGVADGMRGQVREGLPGGRSAVVDEGSGRQKEGVHVGLSRGLGGGGGGGGGGGDGVRGIPRDPRWSARGGGVVPGMRRWGAYLNRSGHGGSTAERGPMLPGGKC